MKKLLFYLFTIFFLFPAIVFADEIIIQDKNGNIRHVAQVSGPANVKFFVSDSAGSKIDGALLRITSEDSSQNRESLVVDGNVQFLNVSPGVWIVSADKPELVLASIEVNDLNSAAASMGSNPGNANIAGSTAGAGTGLGGGLGAFGQLGVSALAIGGIAGVSVAINEASDDDKKEISPSS